MLSPGQTTMARFASSTGRGTQQSGAPRPPPPTLPSPTSSPVAATSAEAKQSWMLAFTMRWQPQLRLVEGVRSTGNGSARGSVNGKGNHARGNATGLTAEKGRNVWRLLKEVGLGEGFYEKLATVSVRTQERDAMVLVTRLSAGRRVKGCVFNLDFLAVRVGKGVETSV